MQSFTSTFSILKEHAIVTVDRDSVELKPAEQGAKIKINGQPLTGPQTLVNKDRVLFGKFWDSRNIYE